MDWQLIESAPRDGSEILAWDGYDYQLIRWHFHGAGEFKWTNDEGQQVDPTHWVRLHPPAANQA